MDVLRLLDVLLFNQRDQEVTSYLLRKILNFTGSSIQDTKFVDSSSPIEKLIRNYELNYQNQRIL
jgi:hypothetical protein